MTLVELLVGLTLLVILGALAAPSFVEFQERQRLKAAAESLQGSLNLARAQALAGQRFYYMQLTGLGSEQWCYSVADDAACDCAATCQPLQKTVNQWPGVQASATRKSFRLNWKNGTALGTNGTITLAGSKNGQRLCVVLSNLGRVRIATARTKPVPGYPQDSACN